MIQVNGVKKENVWVEIEVKELTRLLMGYLKISSDSWIRKNDDGKLAVFYDGGGSHYYECQERVLNEEETLYYESVNNVIKYITSKEKQ